MYKRIFQLLSALIISLTVVSTAMAAQASGISIEVVASKSMRFSWTPGIADGSIVTMRLQATPESAPVDGTDYIAQSDYSLAPQTSASSGNFVVYKGSGNSVTVNGLAQNTTYTIAVYNYTGSGEGTDYLQLDPAQLSQATNGPAMHNYDNGADCGVCHSNHGNSGLVPRGTNQEDVCKTCHNPLGVAAAMSDITIHGTPNHAAADVDCGSCHELHRINPGGGSTTESTHPVTLVTDYNLAFVRANVDKYISTATTDDAVNQTKGNDQAIEGGDAITSRGVCQACHTATDYHRNNSAVEVSQCHKGGTSDSCDGSQVICTDCHAHSGGFEPAGGCIACHSSTQGGTPPADRRAIVTEFNNASTHIGFLSLVDEDCTVCHQQSSITPSHNHQDGFLTLWNVDDHASSGYQLGDHTDPLTSSTEAAKLNVFCLTCHDSDGAQAELDPAVPFSGSIAPVDIATNWSPSSHATSPVSCLGNGAFGCHGGGHGGEKLNLLAPASPAATSPDFAEEEEGFCYNCHDGSPASTNIQAEFAKGTNGTDIFHHPVVDSEQGVGRTVECKDCHNPHEATSANKLAGVSGIDFDGSAVDSATAEYQVCFKCHGDSYNTSRARTTNKRTDFAPDRSSYHPIAQRGRNRSQAMVNNLISPWTIDSVMTCSDCHNNNVASGPQGPHGSTNFSILKKAYWKDLPNPSSFNTANFALCFECHSSTPFTSGSSNTSNFASGGDMFHSYHVQDLNTICAYCHYNVHSNENESGTEWRINSTTYTSPPTNWKTRMINFLPGEVTGCCGYSKPTWQINTNTRNRTCFITCHGKSHGGSESYTPSSSQDNDNLALPGGG